MEKHRSALALRHVRALFEVGAVGGQSDLRLLHQFSTGHREAAEAAFAALVERHGPMVLRVCRGVLGDSHDVHDAFQATFLVLVRKADSLWIRDSLGPWLHSVAVRVANKARVASARRKVHERRGAENAHAVRTGASPSTISPSRFTTKSNDCPGNTACRSCCATSRARPTRPRRRFLAGPWGP